MKVVVERKKKRKNLIEKSWEDWKKIEKTWIGDFVYAILGLILAYITYHFILAYILHTPTPIVAVVSSSMEHINPEVTYYGWLEKNLGYNRSYIESWPFPNGLNVGDMPIVMGSDEYKVGDIIVYQVDGIPAPIIHRVIKINPDGTFQTKGDNNLTQLPYEKHVPKEKIYGKVIFIIPKIGYVKVLINKIFGLRW